MHCQKDLLVDMGEDSKIPLRFAEKRAFAQSNFTLEFYVHVMKLIIAIAAGVCVARKISSQHILCRTTLSTSSCLTPHPFNIAIGSLGPWGPSRVCPVSREVGLQQRTVHQSIEPAPHYTCSTTLDRVYQYKKGITVIHPNPEPTGPFQYRPVHTTKHV